MKRPWRPVALAIAAVTMATAPPAVAPAHAAVPRTVNACAGSGTAANAVIRFYRAVDRRQYTAAYQCFSLAEQARLPYARFVAGYASSVASQIQLADVDALYGPSAAGQVTLDLHATDRSRTGLVMTTFRGYWTVDRGGRLDSGHVRIVRRTPVRAVPALNTRDIFAFDGQQILYALPADVTGDGVRDGLYITGGAPCGSCHVQRIWVFSAGRLVFEEGADNGSIKPMRGGTGFEIRKRAADSGGPECCSTRQTVEEWSWSPNGFVLTSVREVKVA